MITDRQTHTHTQTAMLIIILRSPIADGVMTGTQMCEINYYLEPLNVHLGIMTTRLAACYLISQLVNDDIKWTLLLQWLVKIKLRQKMQQTNVQILCSKVNKTCKLIDNRKLWPYKNDTSWLCKLLKVIPCIHARRTSYTKFCQNMLMQGL